jgi:DNA-binding CsgD family transcriptional regulator
MKVKSSDPHHRLHYQWRLDRQLEQMALTPRQSELIWLLATDHTMKEAACLMRPPTTEMTVKMYAKQARRRLGFKTTYGLVFYIARWKEETNIQAVLG